MEDADSKLVKGLVLWYGLYQFIHIFVNVRGLWLLGQGGIDFPAPPPPGGWSEQALHFFIAIASLDLINALLTLLFVYGFLRQTRWRWQVGSATLSVSLYAALIFDYATIAGGAWTTANLPAYLFINVTFLPVLWLCGWMWVRSLQGGG